MKNVRVGSKIWFTIDTYNTEAWLTRKQARENREKGALLIEHTLTPTQRKGIESIANDLFVS